MRNVFGYRYDHVRQTRPHGFDADQVFDLRRDDEYGHGRREPRVYRAGYEVDQEPCKYDVFILEITKRLSSSGQLLGLKAQHGNYISIVL